MENEGLALEGIVTLARLMKISPKVFVDELTNKKENGEYMKKIMKYLVPKVLDELVEDSGKK